MTKFPIYQPSCGSVGCAGQTIPMHGGPTSKRPLHIGSAASVFVQISQHTFSGPGESILERVRAVLAAKGGQHNIRQVDIVLCLIRAPCLLHVMMQSFAHLN